MSDNIEITVNNPLNILDQKESLSTESDEYDTGTSGDLSFDSDEESTVSSISFLKEGKNKLSCYVCFEDTSYVSPCKCKIGICNDCFVEVIINNGKDCTICRERFEESIISDIKNTFSEVSHSSEELNRSLEFRTRIRNRIINRNRNRKFRIFIYFIMSLLVFFTAPVLGVAIKLILYGYFYGDIFTFQNYIIGFIFWTNVFFLIILMILIYKLFKYLYEQFTLMLYYYLIGT